MSASESSEKTLLVECDWECGVCSAVCKQHAVSYGEGHVRISSRLCSRCMVCVKVCPAGLLEEHAFC